MHIASIGIDIGKTTFHLVALNQHGSIVVRKRFSRNALLAYTAQLTPSLIGMESCGGAHFLARALRTQGHDARLMAAKFVKPFRKSNKNDYRDAEAIGEAVSRGNMRFVPIKTDEQLDLQGLHRVRARLVRNRTIVINQIRGLLLERGITFNKGILSLRKEMPALLEDAEQQLTPRLRALLHHLWQEWKYLDDQVDLISGAVDAVAESDAACQRLQQIPGVGPLVATATVAAVRNGAAFKCGRDFTSTIFVERAPEASKHSASVLSQLSFLVVRRSALVAGGRFSSDLAETSLLAQPTGIPLTRALLSPLVPRHVSSVTEAAYLLGNSSATQVSGPPV